MKKSLQKFLLLLWLLIVPLMAHAEPHVDEINDPYESFNRKIFWFNDRLDTYFMQPISRGYHWIMPDPVERSVTNVFDTLSYPSYLVSSLIQGKFAQSGDHTMRFLINATLGIVGIFDVATDLGFPRHKEDFGTALAYNGVDSGPYIVLPFLGPSTVRDGLSRIVDTVLSPIWWVSQSNANDDTRTWVPIGAQALDFVNQRAQILEAVDAGKEASSDFYLFAQSSYYQYRKGLIFDGKAPDEEEDIFGEPGGPAASAPKAAQEVDPDELKREALQDQVTE